MPQSMHYTLQRPADGRCPDWSSVGDLLRHLGFGVVTNNGDVTEVLFNSQGARMYPPGATPASVRAEATGEASPVANPLSHRARYVLTPIGRPEEGDVSEGQREAASRALARIGMRLAWIGPAQSVALSDRDLFRPKVPRDVAMRMRVREAVESAFPFDPALPATDYERDLMRIVLLAAELPCVERPEPVSEVNAAAGGMQATATGPNPDYRPKLKGIREKLRQVVDSALPDDGLDTQDLQWLREALLEVLNKPPLPEELVDLEPPEAKQMAAAGQSAPVQRIVDLDQLASELEHIAAHADSTVAAVLRGLVTGLRLAAN